MKTVSVTIEAEYDLCHSDELDTEWVANNLLSSDRFSTQPVSGDRFAIRAASSGIRSAVIYDPPNQPIKLLLCKLRNMGRSRAKGQGAGNAIFDKEMQGPVQPESAEFRVTNTTTGAVHRFDYRSEAESFYDAAVAEYGPLHGYELTVLIRRHTPPEMLGAGG